MATAQDLKTAIGNKDIPIDIVPDHLVGGKNYGQELANNQPRGTFKYGSGPSTYSNIAPGTKTLGYKAQQLNEAQFEENKRATGVAEQISLAKLAMQRDQDSRAKQTSGNPEAFQQALQGMMKGHTMWMSSGEKGGQPHNYAPYIDEYIQWGMRTEMPMSSAEIASLQSYAEKLSAQETSILKGYGNKSSSITDETTALIEKALGGGQ